jgi:catechol 2,3-dioxygenase
MNYNIHPKTIIQDIHLSISHVQQSMDFYCTGLGLTKKDELNKTIILGNDHNASLVYLRINPKARPRPQGTTGLYHVAFRFSTRADLASIFRNMLNMGIQFDGFADHGVCEALYLTDPNGISVELYADKPRDQWPMEAGQLNMVTASLDMQELAEEATMRKPDTDMRIGHLHFTVSTIEKSEKFYSSILGYRITQKSLPGAVFLAAGDYHHHIGVNTWQGTRIPSAPPNSTGLTKFSIRLPDSDAYQQMRNHLQELKYPFVENHLILAVKDPDGIEIDITYPTLSQFIHWEKLKATLQSE